MDCETGETAVSDSHRLAHVPNSPPIGGACSVGNMLKGRSGFSRWYFFRACRRLMGPAVYLTLIKVYCAMPQRGGMRGNEREWNLRRSVWLCPLHASCSSDSILLVRGPLVVPVLRLMSRLDGVRPRSFRQLGVVSCKWNPSLPVASWPERRNLGAAGLVMRSSYPKRDLADNLSPNLIARQQPSGARLGSSNHISRQHDNEHETCICQNGRFRVDWLGDGTRVTLRLTCAGSHQINSASPIVCLPAPQPAPSPTVAVKALHWMYLNNSASSQPLPLTGGRPPSRPSFFGQSPSRRETCIIACSHSHSRKHSHTPSTYPMSFKPDAMAKELNLCETPPIRGVTRSPLAAI